MQSTIGYGLRGLVVVALGMDASLKLLQTQAAVEGSVPLGFAADSVLTIGLIEAACLLLFAIPRTAFIGALLITAYCGGAVATHLRLGNPLVTHVLSAVYVAVVMWLGLWLSEPRLRRLIVQGEAR